MFCRFFSTDSAIKLLDVFSSVLPAMPYISLHVIGTCKPISQRRVMKLAILDVCHYTNCPLRKVGHVIFFDVVPELTRRWQNRAACTALNRQRTS